MTKRMITSYSEAAHILSCPHSIANRKEKDYNTISSVDANLGKQVKEFFQHWPMYNDGSEHKRIRDRLLKVLSCYEFTQRNLMRKKLEDTISGDCIDNFHVKKCVLWWHSLYFGIDQSNNQILMSKAESLIDLVIFHNYEAANEAKDAIVHINNFFSRRDHIKEGLVSNFLAEGVAYGAIMNFLIDSYTPMIAGATSVLFRIFNENLGEIPNAKDRQALIWDTLNKLPPFRYINRILPNNGVQDSWVCVDVHACNDDFARLAVGEATKKRIALTFGTGRHMCLGFRPAMDFFDDLILIAGKICADNRTVVEGKPNNSLPVCSVDDFRVTVQRRRASSHD